MIAVFALVVLCIFGFYFIGIYEWPRRTENPT